MKINTKHFTMRPWSSRDAISLLYLASDPDLAHAAGWPALQNLHQSQYIIDELLTSWGFFAITTHERESVIGCISILIGEASNYEIGDNEGELTFWLGKPYWGHHIMQEVINGMLRFSLKELKLDKVWCGCSSENTRSKRLQEKCGFTFQYAMPNSRDLLGNVHTELVHSIVLQDMV